MPTLLWSGNLLDLTLPEKGRSIYWVDRPLLSDSNPEDWQVSAKSRHSCQAALDQLALISPKRSPCCADGHLHADLVNVLAT